MEHSFLDELSVIDSPIHRLEARTKIVAFTALILAAVFLPPELTWPFAGYLGFLAALIALARLPLLPLLKRTAVFGPFILTAVLLLPFTRQGNGEVALAIPIGPLQVRIYRAGLLSAKGVLLKSLISAFSVILLVSTTSFSRLLRALERMHFPRLLLTVMALLYRYLFLLLGEFLRLTRASRARNWEAGSLRIRLRAIGGILGSLFLRTYGRGERVYTAMLARGYDGHFRTLTETSLSRRDYAAMAGLLAAVLAVFVPAVVSTAGFWS